MPNARQQVWFVTHSDALGSGSTRMRANQLVAMVEPYLRDRYALSVIEMPAKNVFGRQRAWIDSRPRGGVYVLTKAAIKRMPVSNARRLQEKAHGVCFDYVDASMRWVNTVGADIHLCSSLTQFDALNERRRTDKEFTGRPMLLLHNADRRLYDLSFASLPAVSAVYWASEANGFLPASVRQRVDVIHVGDAADADRTIGELPRYNLHYAVRNRTETEPDVFKPFTRGFVAALCQSNVVALRTTQDVTAFLGDDYPYLCEGYDDAEIADVLDRAAGDFGGTRWQQALDRMRAMADRVSPESIASQLEAVLKELGN